MRPSDLNQSVDRVRYRIADRWSVEAYADRLREPFLFGLDNLSRAERRVVETAIAQSRYEITDGDEAARSLLDQLAKHEQIAESSTLPAATPSYRIYEPKLWLVRYDGNEYFIQYVKKTYE